MIRLKCACMAFALIVLCGCGFNVDSTDNTAVLHQPDGTEGVGVFDTPLWGVVTLEYVWHDGLMVHGGDVFLDPELLIEDLTNLEESQFRTVEQGLVRRGSHTPWARVNGTVTIPYLWDNMSDTKKQKVRKAMDNWEAELPFIRFEHRPNATGRRVRIVGKNQAYCYVYMRNTGETVLQAGNPCSWHTHVHELGHVMGLRHEQLRQDRPSKVNFYKDRTSSPSQFCWNDGTYCIGKDYLGTSYDTASIMQYPSCMLTKQSNCGPTTPAKWVMENRSGNGYIPWWERRSFGQVLSAADKCGVKTMYGMSCSTPTPPPTCVPKTCADLGRDCGGASDGCAGTLSCGSCAGGETCNSGACVAVDPFPVASWVTGTIQNDATGTTLCAEGENSPTDGAPIAMTTCSSTRTQQNFTFTRSGQFKSYSTKHCAQIEAEASGALVSQYICAPNNPLQQWKLGNMEIVNGRSGKCLDVPSGDYRSDQNVIVWDCNGAGNQRFTYDLQSRELRIQGWCLAGGATAATPVTLQSCDGSDAQEWDSARGGFTNRANMNLCLAIDGGAASPNGTNVVLSSCTDAVGQMWALRGQVEHSNDEFCLRAGATGTDLSIATCDAGSAEQRLTIWSNFGCTPTTCAELGATCGTIADDCGGTEDCGACEAGLECNGSNVCQASCDETDEQFCARVGSACGLTVADDACGYSRSVACGVCGEMEHCSENTCVFPSQGSLFSRTEDARGICAEIAGAVQDDGAALVPWICNGEANQLWHLDQQSRLRAAHSDKCAAVVGSPAAGAPVEQHPCTEDENQRWQLSEEQSIGEKVVRRGEVRDASGAFCLNAPPDEGDQITLEACDGSVSQHWALFPLDGFTPGCTDCEGDAEHDGGGGSDADNSGEEPSPDGGDNLTPAPGGCSGCTMGSPRRSAWPTLLVLACLSAVVLRRRN